MALSLKAPEALRASGILFMAYTHQAYMPGERSDSHARLQRRLIDL